MKPCLLSTALFLLLTTECFAQKVILSGARRGNYDLLKWEIESGWHSGIIGFNLKDKEFIRLNSETITIFGSPQRPIKNSFRTTETDSLQQSYLSYQKRVYSEKVFGLQLSEFSQEEASEWIESGIPSLNISKTRTHKEALIMGFGFISKLNENTQSTYYLFSQLRDGTEQLLDTIHIVTENKIENSFEWNVETKIQGRNSLIIEFELLNTDSLSNEFVNSILFQVVHPEQTSSFKKLDPRTQKVYFLIEDIDLKKKANLSLDFIEYYGYQGEPYYFEYDPALYFTDLKVPPVNVEYVDPDPLARRKKGMMVTWDIDPAYNKQIEKVTLTCKETFQDQDTVYSVDIPVESRSFVDTLAIPGNSFRDYTYLLTVDFIHEIETQTSYQDFRFDAPLPPKPKNPDDQPGNLQYQVFKDGSTYKVKFTWEDPVNYPVSGYRMAVAYDENDGLGIASDVPLIQGNEYIFTPYNNLGQHMKFAFKAIREDGTEGELSRVLSFPTPSSSIYGMRMFNVEIQRIDNRARLTWKKYSTEVKDLKGIQIVRDGEVIAELDRNATEWTSEPLPPGKHGYQVRAVTLYGLQSWPSLLKTVTIE